MFSPANTFCYTIFLMSTVLRIVQCVGYNQSVSNEMQKLVEEINTKVFFLIREGAEQFLIGQREFNTWVTIGRQSDM